MSSALISRGMLPAANQVAPPSVVFKMARNCGETRPAL